MGEKPTKRAIQAQKSKKKIYETAMALIYKKGFDGITVDEICKKTGISKGLFYNYFPSKDALFTELSKDINNIQDDIRALFHEGQTFLERLIIFVENNAKLLNAPIYEEATRTAYSYALKNPGKSFYCSRTREYYVLLKEIVLYGQSRGELRTDLSPEYISDFFAAATWGFFFATLIGFQNESPLPEYIKPRFELLYSALRPQG